MKKWFVTFIILISIVSCKENSFTGKITSKDENIELVKQLTEQVKNNPDSAPVRMRLVNALDSLRQYDAALAQVDSLIKRDSLNNGLWFAKGQLHESIKDTLGAIKSFEKAVSIYASVESQLSLANLLAETKNKKSLAICNAVQRVAMDRTTEAHCDFIAGVYFARTGEGTKALLLFDRAINNNYTYMEAYMEKGFIYYDQKKYKEALAVFDRAITINNQYADAYYWKAKTNEAAGDKQEAITNYQRSLGMDKGLKEARAALERLEGN